MADRDYSTSDQVGTYTTANEILGVGKIPIPIGAYDECIIKNTCLSPGNANPKPLEIYSSGYECPAEKYIKSQDDYTVTLYGRIMILDELNRLPSDSYLRRPTFVSIESMLTSYNHEHLVDKFNSYNYMKLFVINV